MLKFVLYTDLTYINLHEGEIWFLYAVTERSTRYSRWQ